MQLRMPHRRAKGYKSPQQIVRVITEAWGEKNFYCLNCSSPKLERTRAGTRALDFLCPRCEARYELKSQGRPLGRKIPDAAYSSMMGAINDGLTPNLFAIHYDPVRWVVRNLILIPRFVFTASAIKKRAPTYIRSEDRRWVGCDIVLANIPQDARISLVLDGQPISPARVRQKYRKLRPLQKQQLKTRGWTLDVWNIVQQIGKKEFSLAEVNAYVGELRRLHPKNRHLGEKIRQQLQRLRDLGFVKFLGRGRYRLVG